MPHNPDGSVFEKAGVRGFLHLPADRPSRGLVLSHGAGGNCSAPVLVAVAREFERAGIGVLRIDLPYRQKRPTGPPSPATSPADRAGIHAAAEVMREIIGGDVFIGGHSYGGRQSSMLAAEEPGLAKGLLLLSYPLHPPAKPEQLRTAHFPKLRDPTVFVHGTADPFGSIAEMTAAIALIAASTRLIVAEGAGHDLKRGQFDVGSALAALLAG